MPLAKKLASLAVPVAVAVVAFLHARAIGSLVDATIPPESAMPFGCAEAHAAVPSAPHRTADAILDRNPFDHTSPLRKGEAVVGALEDPWTAPPCKGVRAMIVAMGEEPRASLVALDFDGKRVLRRTGGEAFGMRVAFVAGDRVWLESASEQGLATLCQARVFGVPAVEGTTTKPAAPVGELEADLANKIVKTGANEYAVDRGAVERLLDMQGMLMKVPIVPEKQGDRVIGVRLLRVQPGSVLGMLGLAKNDVLTDVNGFEVSDPAKILEAYARFRGGALDHLTLHVLREGKPLNIDYVIR